MLIVRAALVVLFLVSATFASQGADKDKATANPKPKTEQQEAAAQLDTTSLEKTIREVVKNAGEKHEPEEAKHLQNEGQLVGYTSDLAVATNGLAKFTLYLVIATAVIGAITLGQFFMFKGQLAVMKQGAIDAGILAAASQATAKAAESQASALVAAQRAYVKASPVPPGLEDPPSSDGIHEHITCNFEVENYGQTPARVTAMVTIFRMVERGVALPDVPDYQTDEKAPFPGHFLGRNEVFYNGHGQGALIGEFVADMNSGELSIFAFGYIDYIDVFGKRHRAGFGRQFHPGVNNRHLYESDEKFSKRCNLAFMRQPGYNYDRVREHGEGNDWGDNLPS